MEVIEPKCNHPGVFLNVPEIQCPWCVIERLEGALECSPCTCVIAVAEIGLAVSPEVEVQCERCAALAEEG